MDPRTGKSIPIKQAIEMGLVDVSDVDKTQNDVVDAPEKDHLDRDIAVLSVTDPRTGREISLERAIQEGIVDTKNGLYIDPVTGETMSLVEALQRSYLKARIAEPGDSDNVIKAKILQISGGKLLMNIFTFILSLYIFKFLLLA